MLEKHSEDSGKYSCSKCSEEFDDRKELRNHKRKAHEQTEIICSVCGLVSSLTQCG